MNERNKKCLKQSVLQILKQKYILRFSKNQNITGYKIAKNFGKKISQTFIRALDAMYQKGMVLLEESNKNKLFIAVPIESYFEQMQKDLVRKKNYHYRKNGKNKYRKREGGNLSIRKH